MRFILRASLGLLAVLIAVRAGCYFVYVYELLPGPGEVGDLESKLVHLAWRVQAGARLYPPWRDYPHVTNFFSPAYFLLVGSIARWRAASLGDLFLIGRVATVFFRGRHGCLSGLGRVPHDGRAAGIVAGMASLGSAPMIGAGLMCRPDTMAEFLGTCGFFLALGSRLGIRLAGLGLLVLGALTKQTALVFLLAAAVTLTSSQRRADGRLVARGRPGCTWCDHRAGYVRLRADVRVVADGRRADAVESRQLDEPDGGVSCARPPTCSSSPRWPCRSGWPTDRAGPRPLCSGSTLLGTGLVTVAKLGSGLNYFLSLRVIEALAVGRLWSFAGLQERPAWRRAACVLVAACSLVPSLMPIAVAARLARNEALFVQSPEGLRLLQAKQQFFRLAENPKIHLLTDSGMLQLYQRGRAAFVDPFQFRLLVDSGVIRPGVILDQIQARAYNLVITSSDLYSPRYESNSFGLPTVLTRAARASYRPSPRKLGLFLYVPQS